MGGVKAEGKVQLVMEENEGKPANHGQLQGPEPEAPGWPLN